MNKKSVPAFVLSLIAGVGSIFVGFYSAWIFVAIFALLASNQYIFFLIVGWVCMIGGVVAIVGGSMCFKRANIGAILLTIVTIIVGGSLVALFVKVLTFSSDDVSIRLTSIILGLFTIIPTIMYIIATICAYRAKPKAVEKNTQQFIYTQAFHTTQTPEQMVQDNGNQLPSNKNIE
jgi:hypothetical protein